MASRRPECGRLGRDGFQAKPASGQFVSETAGRRVRFCPPLQPLLIPSYHLQGRMSAAGSIGSGVCSRNPCSNPPPLISSPLLYSSTSPRPSPSPPLSPPFSTSQKLLPKLHSRPTPSEASGFGQGSLEEEFEMVRQASFTEPDDQSG
ncbi:unnamed protein product [Closterium sp. NIES-54]